MCRSLDVLVFLAGRLFGSPYGAIPRDRTVLGALTMRNQSMSSQVPPGSEFDCAVQSAAVALEHRKFAATRIVTQNNAIIRTDRPPWL